MITLYQGRAGITRDRGGLKGADKRDLTVVIYIRNINVHISKSEFSCKIFKVGVQIVVILFEIDVRLQKKAVNVLTKQQ